jgi:hypothetical protein
MRSPLAPRAAEIDSRLFHGNGPAHQVELEAPRPPGGDIGKDHREGPPSDPMVNWARDA